MNFDYTPEQAELRQAAAEFGRAELNTNLIDDDAASRFSREHWEKAAKFGIHGLAMPEQYGGTERDLLSTVIAMEGLGYGCRDNGLIFSINAHIWSAQIPLLRFGHPACPSAADFALLFRKHVADASTIVTDGAATDSRSPRGAGDCAAAVAARQYDFRTNRADSGILR